ncbi:MarR family winged helix-turn-helix transcriptional regulator [Novosphingobium beihaiensis]|uniref:MarR family winged helix-turn-helix transcriptional regulator n=1 Tax=Novosphingobium beihaiensis TaxID=2930389 RepID=A0ABT0BNZ2_9SPHN|nr:MarR family winged helix-turn-helix transcriptional regulator [Novosphingobium beihaiensis]MCJ2186556.1 MarR family winged helix-turn-helix transcriptional regulator [Novosphingobium beihaiensis]
MDRNTFTEDPPFGCLERSAPPADSHTPEYTLTNFPKNSKNTRAIAHKLYQTRRMREQVFSEGLFSDPAWDILLDLYMAEEEQKKIYITSACLAAGVPTSTGLRWITILIQNGYVERHNDPSDARRSFLRLTGTARHALETVLGQLCNG